MTLTRRPAVILVEPDINPVTRRFGLPLVACYPPLAQVRLAAQLDADVTLADLRLPGERDRLLSRLRSAPPDLIGVSVTFTSNGDEAIDTMESIRRVSPRVPIVLGGTAASEDPASFYHSPADRIAHRTGDASLPALVRELATSGALPPSFPGFFHRENGAWRLEPAGPSPALADLRPAAWHLIPSRWWRRYHQGLRPTGIGQMSEGCPFDCTFCSVWKVHGRRVALASAANVRHDLESLPGCVRGFFLADDIWMQATEAQLRELHDPLLSWVAGTFRPKRGDFWFTVETRTDLYLRQEPRFRDWIRRGGVRWILFGVEGATDEQLDAFSKRNTVNRNSEAIRRACAHGAWVVAQMVIPCDASEGDFDDMELFLRDHRPWLRGANFTIATPLPGTDLYAQAVATHPELADRRRVSHPGFSLFTALTPTRLEPRRFYERVAALYRTSHQARLRPEIVRQGVATLLRSPWLIPRLTRIPAGLRALTHPAAFLEAHTMVQGRRLLDGTAPQSAPWMTAPEVGH